MNREQSKTPSLFAALLVGLFVNLLLARQSGYWARVGVLLAPLSIAVLASTGWMFARAWRMGQNRLYRLLFALLLIASSVLELLRVWRLAADLYPDGITLAAICITVLLPVVYLRRVSSISQTANVLLCLLLGALALMLLSVAGHLRVQNLQMQPLTWQGLGDAMWAQWTLYPEFLLPALWPSQEKRGRHTLLRLAGWATLFSAALHLLLELFYGQALPGRQNPLHTAAQSGALSVFNRLEWVQLLLWIMVISVKLALYLYALVRLGGGQSKAEDTAVGLDRFPLYLGGMLLLCVVFRQIDVEQALLCRNALLWCFAGLVGIGGGLQWLFTVKKPC